MDVTKDRDEKESGEWTDLMDRNGLVHVKDTVYQFICAIETEMWSPLNALPCKRYNISTQTCRK